MKEGITREIVEHVCCGLGEVALAAIEDKDYEFTYTLAVVDFIATLRAKGKVVSLNDFMETLQNIVYEEVTQIFRK